MSTDPAMLDRVLLTDDEVLALAAQRGLPWPTAIPTVDVRDEEAAHRAVVRGLRSLLVRSLAGEAVPGPSLAPLIEPVLGGSGVLAAYAADRDLTLVPTVVSTAHYADDGLLSSGRCITEVVAPSGIHQLSRSTMEAAQKSTVRLLNIALKSEALEEDPDSGTLACVCAVGPASEELLRMAVARRGEIRAGRRDGGVASFGQLAPITSALAAVKFLTEAE